MTTAYAQRPGQLLVESGITPVPMACIVDLEERTVSDPSPRVSLEARGYWEFGAFPLPSWAFRSLGVERELWTGEDEAKHPRDDYGKFTEKDWSKEWQSLNPGNDFFAFMPGIALRSARAGAELTQEEKDALLAYQRGSYDINKMLRGNPYGQPTPEEIARLQAKANTIAAVIREKGLKTEREYVWRGVDGQSFTGLSTGFKRLIGKVIEDKGFLSTVPTKDERHVFGTIDLRIRVPAGTKFVELTGDSEGTEWLFPPGARLMVDDYFPRESSRRPVFEVTMLP